MAKKLANPRFRLQTNSNFLPSNPLFTSFLRRRRRTERMMRRNGRMPAIQLEMMRKGATQNTTPGTMRRKTRGRRNLPRAKTPPLNLPGLVLDRHLEKAPKSSGLPGQRSTSPPRRPSRSHRREASPSAPSPRWTATGLYQTGGRRWRCCHPAAAWEARAR